MSENETPPISRVLIGRHLTFHSLTHHRAVTCFENVRQPNIRGCKKLGFQLSHKHPVQVNFEVLMKYFFFITSKFLSMKIFLLNKLN